MAQIVVLPLIPILWGHAAPIMPIISCSIVDQNLRWTQLPFQIGESGFERRNVAQITGCEAMRAV